MSHFSMFLPTKATVKLANGNTGNAQVIGIILCIFPNCYIMYTVVPVYYFQVTLPTPSHQMPSNYMLDFKILRLNLLKILTLLTIKDVLGDHLFRFKIILTIFKSKLSKSNIT